MARRICLVCSFLIFTLLALGQDHPQSMCSLPELDVGRQQLSVVKSTATTSWQCYANGNCSSGEAQRGDTVQPVNTTDGWTCGYVTTAKGAGPAWIPSSDLTAVDADANPSLKAWFGIWHGGEDLVDILPSQTNGRLTLKGTAIWNGSNGNQHFGNLKGEATPVGNELHYTDGDTGGCVVDMKLIGDYILASDNQKCGALNARFSGVWRRRKGS